MSFDNYKYNQPGQEKSRKIKKQLKNQGNNQEGSQSDEGERRQYHQNQQDQFSENDKKQHKKKTKKGSKNRKKKIDKQQQNQGLRIVRQKKIQYLFRHICNPNGHITLQSLGRALAKHKIEFKVSQLQQMIALCCSQQLNEEESSSFDSQINETIRGITINIEQFRQFYLQKF